MEITIETRRESFEAVKATAKQRRAIILEILNGKELTASEIAEELHARRITPSCERNYAAPRLTELKEEGRVKAIGKKLCQKTGRNVSVWAIDENFKVM